MRCIKNAHLFCSCWKVAGWSGGASIPVDNKAAVSPNMTKLSRMWFHGAAGRCKAKPPLSPSPQNGTTPVAGKSHLPPTSPNCESREKPPVPPRTPESGTPRPLKPRLNSSKTVTESTPEPSLASLHHPVSYPSPPVTGWEQAGLSRETAAGSRWPSSWSLCWRFRFHHDRRVFPSEAQMIRTSDLAFNSPQYRV